MVFARQVLAGMVKITRNMSSKDYPGFIPIYGITNLQIPVIRNEWLPFTNSSDLHPKLRIKRTASLYVS